MDGRTDPSLLHALQIAVAKPIQDRLRANSKVVDSDGGGGGHGGDYDAVRRGERVEGGCGLRGGGGDVGPLFALSGAILHHVRITDISADTTGASHRDRQGRPKYQS